MAPDDHTRPESDSMGEMQIPSDGLWGASTQRAVENFPISGARFGRRFIGALGLIKRCAAEVNADLGAIETEVAGAIVKAADEVVAGDHDDQFVVDIFQTGSGTSTHMNANEVIANRAAELLGAERGSKRVHPNDHVNHGQSSNDVIPTTIHLAALVTLKEALLPALENLEEALLEKSRAFWEVIKTGRTHLQDATPIRLGQEMLGYAGQLERAHTRLRHTMDELAEVALGGTAVGTGINTHPEFAARVCEKLSAATGVTVRETTNHFQAQSTVDTAAAASATVRGAALALYKIANDFSWLGSGPRAGYGELVLPAVQPGSSIMPGKVNPVIAEALIQVCALVVGNDATIAFAAQRSIFELNTTLPLVAYRLLEAIELLAAATDNFTERCVRDLTATSRGPDLVERGLALATSLVPAIGYDAAAKIAKEAASSGRTVREVALEQTDLTDQQLAELLDPATLTAPRV